MNIFKANEIEDKLKYKLLIASVIPRPVCMLSTLNDNESLNLAPFSFYNIVSYNPGILSISIQRKNGEMKDSVKNILRNKEAVLHIVDNDILEEVNKTSIELEYGVSELDYTNLTAKESISINTPLIKEAKIAFETKLYQHIPIKNDDGDIISDLILLKVLIYYVSNKVYENGYIISEKLNPISRLAGNSYSKLGEEIVLERPKK